MKKYIYIIALICFLAVIGIEPYIAFSQQPVSPNMELTGEELFIQQRCVRCHSIGRGRFVGPDLQNIGNKYSKEQIVNWIENPQLIYQQSGKMPYNEGYPPMPPMNVPPGQANKIADYLLSFKVPDNLAATGTITGQVLNETNDGPAPNVDLVLTSYMGDRPTDTKTIKSDEQGNYSFKDLGWDRSYELTVNYKGAQYSTDKMVFSPDEDTMILDLPIYEPTFEEEDISIIESHMIMQVVDGALSVANITLYSNNGSKIYVGGQETGDNRRESLKFNIPDGAQDVNFIHGVKPEDLVQTEYGFADTTSILPGQRRVVYTYGIPLNSGSTKINRIIDYPTDNFLLLISATDKTTEVSGLTQAQEVEVQGERFLKWTGTQLSAGDDINIVFQSKLLKTDYIKWIALGFLLLVIIAGLVYSTLSKPKTEQKSRVVDKSSNEDIRLGLVKEIAKLDDDYEAGNVDEESYRKLRNKKKEELKKIIRRL